MAKITAEKITVTEFCKRLSLTNKKVELIGGFHSWMQNTKKITRGTQAEFMNYFTDFCTMPA